MRPDDDFRRSLENDLNISDADIEQRLTGAKDRSHQISTRRRAVAGGAAVVLIGAAILAALQVSSKSSVPPARTTTTNLNGSTSTTVASKQKSMLLALDGVSGDDNAAPLDATGAQRLVELDPATGAVKRELLPTSVVTAQGDALADAAILPNGHLLVEIASRPEGSGATRPCEASSIVEFDTSNKVVSRIRDAFGMSVSKDGKWFSYATYSSTPNETIDGPGTASSVCDGPYLVHVSDVDTNLPDKVVMSDLGDVTINSTAISPNGKKIAVSLYDNQGDLTAHVYTADKDQPKTGSELVASTNGGDYDSSPSWLDNKTLFVIRSGILYSDPGQIDEDSIYLTHIKPSGELVGNIAKLDRHVVDCKRSVKIARTSCLTNRSDQTVLNQTVTWYNDAGQTEGSLQLPATVAYAWWN